MSTGKFVESANVGSEKNVGLGQVKLYKNNFGRVKRKIFLGRARQKIIRVRSGLVESNRVKTIAGLVQVGSTKIYVIMIRCVTEANFESGRVKKAENISG